jgi:hypothetical protein
MLTNKHTVFVTDVLVDIDLLTGSNRPADESG